MGPEGGLDLALLMEVNLEGRFTRLELTTSEGMLTLHPEPDRAWVEGNVVSERGVTPISLAWSSDHVLWVRDSPIAEILTGRGTIADVHTRPGLLIDAALNVVPATRAIEEGSGPPADDRGVPVLEASDEWDLEP